MFKTVDGYSWLDRNFGLILNLASIVAALVAVGSCCYVKFG